MHGARRALLARAALLAVAAPWLSGCTHPRAARPVATPAITSMAQWGGSASAAPAVPQRVSHLTVHHQGETWPRPGPGGDDVVAYLRRLQSWSRLSKRWSDIPYHYIVAPDGRIYAARDEGVPGDTNTEYDPGGHLLVMLMGNFEDVQPTPAQLESAVALMAWLAQRHHLDPQSIASHRDYSKQTTCPGRHLYRYLENGWLREAVAARLNGQVAALP
jgi:hypothetical protein